MVKNVGFSLDHGQGRRNVRRSGQHPTEVSVYEKESCACTMAIHSGAVFVGICLAVAVAASIAWPRYEAPSQTR
jgi:hypothetical protein